MDTNFDQFEQDIQEKPIEWREIFEKFVFHWKWFAFSAVLALITGAVYSRLQNDVYEVKASVLIIDQARSGQMNEMSVLKQLDAVGMGGSRSSSMINNEEQVIKSTALMKRVVSRLELYTSYSHKVYLKSEDLYTAAPIYVHIDSTTLANLKSSISFNISQDNDQLLVKGICGITKFEQTLKSLPAVVHTPAGNITIQYRAGISSLTEPINVGINSPVAIAKSLSGGAMTTEVGKMVDVINITFHTSNIQKGQDILNTLASIYNQDASEQNNISAINTARFIDERLDLLNKELSEVEMNIEKYKQTNNMTDIKEDAQSFLTKNSLYDEKQIELEMQQHLVKYVEDFINNPANQYSPIPNLGLTDMGMASVILKYDELIMNRERIGHSSTNENPALMALNQEITSTRKAIKTSIANSRKGLQISNTDISSQNSKMQSKIRNIPRQEREYIEMKRQQQVKESLFLFLLHKREEATLNMAVAVPKSRVLDTPDDASFVGPHRSLILLIFLLIGLLIPALIIYVMDLVNSTITSRHDVEKLTEIPVITELGHDDSNSIIIDYKPNASSNSELFRLLRTKLQFTLDHPSEKVILVTSTMSGEGKTFVSINLSIMLSLADKKVLILGMDLRNPQLAKHFGIKDKDGLTAYLSGQEADYKSLIHKLKIFSSLDVLPAGVVPPNPTELIMKERFDSLIEELKNQYDYIIIDSAPVGAVSDTYLIDRVSNLTLYICRSGYTDKRNIEFVNRIKMEKSLKRLYFVVNDVDLESSRYSYHSKYGYGYGKYKYGYGYGYGKGKKNSKQ